VGVVLGQETGKEKNHLEGEGISQADAGACCRSEKIHAIGEPTPLSHWTSSSASIHLQERPPCPMEKGSKKLRAHRQVLYRWPFVQGFHKYGPNRRKRDRGRRSPFPEKKKRSPSFTGVGVLSIWTFGHQVWTKGCP